MLRVGIISAAWGAFAHLPAWRAVPGVEVTGICTSRRATAEATAARTGIPRAFWDAGAMATDPDIDIVDCGTRPNIRYPMVLAALAAGKHVYNGIPFAKDLAAARALHAAWRAAGTVGVVDAYAQWLPAHRQARRMIDDGFLGRPFAGTCSLTMALFNRPAPDFAYRWFAEAGQGVSALRNLGSHALHMLVFLFGPVIELVAEDRRALPEWTFTDGSSTPVGTNDHAALLLRFASGVLIQLQVSWSAAVTAGWSLDVHGSDGRLALSAPSFPTSTGTVLRAGRVGDAALTPVAIPQELVQPPGIAIGTDVVPEAAHGMAISMRNMVDAIAGKAQAGPDFGQAWEVERILEAARRSSETRAWTKIDDIG